MYIDHHTAQYFVFDDSFDKEQCTKDHRPHETVPNTLPKPDFMPTKLVRISDMKLIRGSQVHEGYCALSYSWNQSGDSVLDQVTGKEKRIDEGKHKIIFPFEKKIRRRGKKNKTRQKIKYVKFEGIIQQICQQFNIKYIWYDQMCINQDDKEEKKREIRNMHRIYSNAYCTVALVPEYQIQSHDNAKEIEVQDIEDAQEILHQHNWSKRLWTLEEAIKSKKLLFVGRNIHSWGEYVYTIKLGVLNKLPSQLGIHEILYHAHQRTSTKDHDRVFALANLFPDIINHINIDYNQDFKDLMIHFYGLLAKKDLRILLFKKRFDDYRSTIQEYSFLPSWTGVHGEHCYLIDSTTSFQNYNVIGKTMYVTGAYLTNNQSIDTEEEDYLKLRYEDIPTLPDGVYQMNEHNDYCLGVAVQLPGTTKEKIIQLFYSDYHVIFKKQIYLDEVSKKLKQLSRFMDIKKQNLCYHYVGSDTENTTIVDIQSFLTEEMVDDLSAHYVILTEIQFETKVTRFDGSQAYNTYFPVIKKIYGEEYYKSIGLYRIENAKYFFSDCNSLPKKTFLIQ